MQVRYYKIQLNDENNHYRSTEMPSSLIITWLAHHKNEHQIIVEVESESSVAMEEYESFYGNRLETLQNTILNEPSAWQILIGNSYEGEVDSDPDKIAKRKAKLYEQLQSLILIPPGINDSSNPSN